MIFVTHTTHGVNATASARCFVAQRPRGPRYVRAQPQCLLEASGRTAPLSLASRLRLRSRASRSPRVSLGPTRRTTPAPRDHSRTARRRRGRTAPSPRERAVRAAMTAPRARGASSITVCSARGLCEAKCWSSEGRARSRSGASTRPRRRTRRPSRRTESDRSRCPRPCGAGSRARTSRSSIEEVPGKTCASKLRALQRGASARRRQRLQRAKGCSRSSRRWSTEGSRWARSIETTARG